MDYLNNVPLEALTLYRIALHHSNKGDHKSAIKYLSNALLLVPTFYTALCEMGLCFEKLGMYPEALSKYDKVLQINQSHKEAEMNRNRVLEKIKLTK